MAPGCGMDMFQCMAPLKKILDPGLVIFGFKMRKICVLVPRKIIMYGI